MINLKDQYKEDTKQYNIAYDRENEALIRIQEIYGTARKGRLSKENSKVLWREYFNRLWEERLNIPFTLNGFDIWIKNEINTLAIFLGEPPLGKEKEQKLGLAQKFINLFLKDLWAFECVSNNISKNFHIPLDRIIFQLFSGAPETWKSWTKVISQSKEKFESLYYDYQIIQNSFRKYQRIISDVFKSALELEQFFWHRIMVIPER